MAPRPIFDRPIAHRGLHNRALGVIENSRSAFEAAIARNFHIECDVQLSRDGVPVIFHDDDLERLTGLKGPAAAAPMNLRPPRCWTARRATGHSGSPSS
jgi:glycerophosphoryl diester phosphodiesterase